MAASRWLAALPALLSLAPQISPQEPLWANDLVPKQPPTRNAVPAKDDPALPTDNGSDSALQEELRTLARISDAFTGLSLRGPGLLQALSYQRLEPPLKSHSEEAILFPSCDAARYLDRDDPPLERHAMFRHGSAAIRGASARRHRAYAGQGSKRQHFTMD
jgi:hypothetical protein